jgi:hypothetical protein
MPGLFVCAREQDAMLRRYFWPSFVLLALVTVLALWFG